MRDELWGKRQNLSKIGSRAQHQIKATVAVAPGNQRGGIRKVDLAIGSNYHIVDEVEEHPITI
jgi:hypothetical protein